MRRAFELAFATAYAFAGSAPLFLEVDHVDFLKPVSFTVSRLWIWYQTCNYLVCMLIIYIEERELLTTE